jgi:hypothetical protein
MIRPNMLRTVTHRYKALQAPIINAKARLMTGFRWLTISLYRFFSEIPVRLDDNGIWRFDRFYLAAPRNSNRSISGYRKTVPGSAGTDSI